MTDNYHDSAKETSGDGSKSFFIKSFGCQMNVYDAERMGDIFAKEGVKSSLSESDADIVVLNTCHIREKAAEKVYSELGRLREIKTLREKLGKTTKIIVAGCVAQAEGDQILRRQPAVDIVVGPQNYHNLIPLLNSGDRAIDIEFPLESKFESLPPPHGERTRRALSAFVTVQEGCDKFCTFCVVPYTRGAETSRNVENVMREVESLRDAGVKEITLIGQNVNNYLGSDAAGRQKSLANLIEMIANLNGIERIRYTTSHPRDMREDLLEAHRDVSKLMPYIHLPVQSGSDRILAAMNRGHSQKDYFTTIDKIRRYNDNIAFSSDFIVGFPGETEAEFEATVKLVQNVFYASAYSFMYSARPGTPAAKMSDQVSDGVKRARLSRLQALLDEQRFAFNESFIGKTVDVLFEKAGRRPGQFAGKTPFMQSVHIAGLDDCIGKLVAVEILERTSNSLSGRINKKTI
jgi:tRNA-2-methylthio-N6-dimethylallyladenosine synthase